MVEISVDHSQRRMSSLEAVASHFRLIGRTMSSALSALELMNTVAPIPHVLEKQGNT